MKKFRRELRASIKRTRKLLGSNPYGRRIRYRGRLRGRKAVLKMLGKKAGMRLWRKRTKRRSKSKYRRTELAKASRFDRRSFRYVKLPRGRRLLIGCPKGQWSARRKRCKTGTRGVSLLRPRGERRARMVLRPSFAWGKSMKRAANPLAPAVLRLVQKIEAEKRKKGTRRELSAAEHEMLESARMGYVRWLRSPIARGPFPATKDELLAHTAFFDEFHRIARALDYH